jgi:RNase P subunit RPR2
MKCNDCGSEFVPDDKTQIRNEHRQTYRFSYMCRKCTKRYRLGTPKTPIPGGPLERFKKSRGIDS